MCNYIMLSRVCFFRKFRPVRPRRARTSVATFFFFLQISDTIGLTCLMRVITVVAIVVKVILANSIDK